jgi:hypothetical protein
MPFTEEHRVSSIDDRFGRSWRSWVLSLLISLGLILACGDGSDEPGEPAVFESWTLAPDPSVVIGQVAGEPQYLFSRIGPARLLPGGRIAVSDRDAAGIRLYSGGGTFELEIGRRGEGPGEFGRITGLSIADPDTLVVYDSGLHRVTKFLTSGALASTLNLRAEDGSPVLLGEFSTGELAVTWIKAASRNYYEMTPDVMQLARFSPEGRLGALLGTETGIVRGGASASAFTPVLHAGVIGDSIFLTNGLLPEIQVWNIGGDLVETLQVPFPAVDPSSAWRTLEEVLLARGNSTELGWFENQPQDGAIPRISRMIVDGGDRLWAKAYNPRTDSALLRTGRQLGGEWLVLRTDGTIIAKVFLPEDFFLLDARGDQVLGKTTDELGVERVLAYQVRH